MSTLHQYIAILGSFQGCLLFILLVSDRRVSGASKVLAFCCLFYGVSFLLPFLTLELAPPALFPAAPWLFFLPIGYCATFYLYCRNVVFDKPLVLADSVHLAPLVFCYLFTIDSILFENAAFRTWIVGSEAPTWRVWFGEYLLVGIAIIYTLAAAWVLNRYRRAAADNLSNYNPAVFKWLGTLVVMSLAILIAKVSWAFAANSSMNVVIFSDFLIVVFVYLVALAQWRSPNLFTIQGLPSEELTLTTKNTPSTSEGTLDTASRVTLFETVQAAMIEGEAYQDAELSLTKLSDITGIGVHHLSEVINKQAGKNFNQYVNQHRINEVCERLQQDSSSSILEISMSAGFSSKSTFNTLFKKAVGSTPSQYRAKASQRKA